MTTKQAEQKIKERVNRFWHDRALEMFRHLTVGKPTAISNLRIAGDWPRRGSIRFTRDADGARFVLRLAAKGWIGERIATP